MRGRHNAEVGMTQEIERLRLALAPGCPVPGGTPPGGGRHAAWASQRRSISWVMPTSALCRPRMETPCQRRRTGR